MHEGQVDVDVDVVRRLVGEQFPCWAGLPVTRLASAATVNSLFRLGDGLVARFPLSRDGSDRVAVEAEAAREFAAVCPVPAPRPVALGSPGPGYSLSWSVQTWVPGIDATVLDPSESVAFAEDLVGLLLALRARDTGGRRFVGAGRGGHLPDHDGWMAECFARSEEVLDVPVLRELWSSWRALPIVDEDLMCHGDLTPPNLLVGGGRLVGVLDTGGFAPADPALDLVAVWHLLESPGRDVVRDGLGCGEVQWQRGQAWAFAQAMGLVWYYRETNPAMSEIGRRTLERLVQASRWRPARD